MDNRKICLVVPSLGIGGQERFSSVLVNYFSSLGHEVHVIFLVHHTPFYTLIDNIRVYWPSFRKKKDKRVLIHRIRVLFYLRRTILNIKPDTVLSLSEVCNILAIGVLLGSKIPVYISDRNSPDTLRPFYIRILRNIFYPFAAGIIAQTQFAKDKLSAIKGVKNSKIAVLPNPIKQMNYYPKESNTKVVLTVGSLLPVKNLFELIEIFSEINHPDWQLHIVGDGPLKEQLTHRIEALRMTDSIFMLGAVTDVDSALSQGDIFAFTSVSEGFPNALNEAMAYPLACIAYDCVTGPSEMIQNDVNGYLIAMGDREDYKRKLKQLMEDESLRERFKKESKRNRDKFALDVVGQRYLNFILGVG